MDLLRRGGLAWQREQNCHCRHKGNHRCCGAKVLHVGRYMQGHEALNGTQNEPCGKRCQQKPFVFPSRCPVEPEQYPQHEGPEEHAQTDKQQPQVRQSIEWFKGPRTSDPHGLQRGAERRCGDDSRQNHCDNRMAFVSYKAACVFDAAH